MVKLIVGSKVPMTNFIVIRKYYDRCLAPWSMGNT